MGAVVGWLARGMEGRADRREYAHKLAHLRELRQAIVTDEGRRTFDADMAWLERFGR